MFAERGHETEAGIVVQSCGSPLSLGVFSLGIAMVLLPGLGLLTGRRSVRRGP